MRANVHEVPIVETGAPNGMLVDAKTELSDEVKGRAGTRAKASDVARVGRDLGLDQNHVKRPLGRRGSKALGSVRHRSHAADIPETGLDADPGRQVASLGRSRA